MTKIYVVIGQTGEYSDHSEWPVCWRESLAEAEKMVARLNDEASEYKRWYDAEDGWESYAIAEQKRAAMTDPSFTCDYTGTTYHVWAIDKEPRS